MGFHRLGRGLDSRFPGLRIRFQGGHFTQNPSPRGEQIRKKYLDFFEINASSFFSHTPYALDKKTQKFAQGLICLSFREGNRGKSQEHQTKLENT